LTLSGGEQQRAHFARFLVQAWCGTAEDGPGVMLLDEPTEGLDLRHQLDLLALLRECAHGGSAVIAVLHDLNLATLFASRIVMLRDGEVAADGAPGAIITDTNLDRVFRIRAKVGSTPPTGVPFILPHAISTARS
jgi:iron complex transport system ATP-binding protein